MFLVISGDKSKKMVTFSDRLVVLHSLQASVDEITEEIGLHEFEYRNWLLYSCSNFQKLTLELPQAVD